MTRSYASVNGDHWKKLLRPPRRPTPLDAGAYVDELNRRLRADTCFREGTRFVVVPSGGEVGRPGASGATSWEGPESMKPVVFRIVQSVAGEFEAAVPFLSER